MILVIDLCWNPDSLCRFEFVLPLVEVVCALGLDAEVRHYKSFHRIPHNTEKIILSGTPLKDVDYLKNPDEFSWLTETKKPALGICAGMQVIAQSFGCEIKPGQEIGLIDVSCIRENPLFSGSFQAYALHNLKVQVNDNFQVLASSKKHDQAIKHAEKNVYGLLFHPEARNKKIIENFLKI